MFRKSVIQTTEAFMYLILTLWDKNQIVTRNWYKTLNAHTKEYFRQPKFGYNFFALFSFLSKKPKFYSSLKSQKWKLFFVKMCLTLPLGRILACIFCILSKASRFSQIFLDELNSREDDRIKCLYFFSVLVPCYFMFHWLLTAPQFVTIQVVPAVFTLINKYIIVLIVRFG